MRQLTWTCPRVAEVGLVVLQKSQEGAWAPPPASVMGPETAGAEQILYILITIDLFKAYKLISALSPRDGLRVRPLT